MSIFFDRDRNNYCQIRFCERCCIHTHHFSRFRSRLGRWFARLSYFFTNSVLLAGWRCEECCDGSVETPTFQSEQQASDQITGGTDPVASLLETELSGCQATGYLDRFSEKFRWRVAERLLEGETTISHVCASLDVSEIQVQRWIRDYVQQLNEGVVSLSFPSRAFSSHEAMPEPCETIPLSRARK